MARPNFITVPEELIEHAVALAEFFDDRGYTVRPEKAEIGVPYTPTMTCKRTSTTLHVEVDSAIRMSRLEEWTRYCKSSSKDTRVAVCVPDGVKRPAKLEANLQQLGVGLYIADEGTVIEVFVPRDVAVNVALPERRHMPKKMRELLGDAYDQFDHSHWRDGFKEACGVLEVEARRYLKSGVGSGRIVVLTEAGNVSALTSKRIDKMTLGRLAVHFARFRSPNHSDAVIARVLDQVNKDRVGATHHKKKAATEARLRKNVGHHMWQVVAALKELLKV